MSVSDMTLCACDPDTFTDGSAASVGTLRQSPDHNTNACYPDYCRTLTIRDSSGQLKELVFPKALDLDRPKRARTTFSSEQLYRLEAEFLSNQYVVGRERTELAQRLALSETQVKVWFQNRRTKYKRDRDREAETKHANAESAATCNILRMLQHRRPAVSGTPLGSSAVSHPSLYAGSGLLRNVASESVLRLPPHLYNTPFT